MSMEKEILVQCVWDDCKTVQETFLCEPHRQMFNVASESRRNIMSQRAMNALADAINK